MEQQEAEKRSEANSKKKKRKKLPDKDESDKEYNQRKAQKRRPGGHELEQNGECLRVKNLLTYRGVGEVPVKWAKGQGNLGKKWEGYAGRVGPGGTHVL